MKEVKINVDTRDILQWLLPIAGLLLAVFMAQFPHSTDNFFDVMVGILAIAIGVVSFCAVIFKISEVLYP